jgi:hypothetical protein
MAEQGKYLPKYVEREFDEFLRCALNLNIHFHMLFLEGAISKNSWGGTTFTRIKAPSL